MPMADNQSFCPVPDRAQEDRYACFAGNVSRGPAGTEADSYGKGSLGSAHGKFL
jgi:hypothetical protein